jgi:two-component system response regulator HydG
MVDIFMQRLRSKTGKSINGIQREALDRLWKYHYPGNVRELKSILQYAFTVAEKGPLSCKHLPPQLSDALSAGKAAIYVPDCKKEREKKALIDALEKTAGNQTRAAQLLGVNRVTVWNRMRKYGLNLRKELKS